MCMYTIPTYIIGIVYIHINYTARLIRMSILMCMYTIYTIYVLNTWVYWCVYALFIDVCIYYIRNTWLYWCVCILYAHVYTDVYIEKPMYEFQNNVCVSQQCMSFKTLYEFHNNVWISKQCMCFTTMYVFLNASIYWNQFNVWNNKWCVSTCVWASGCTEYLYMQHICITHSEFVGGQIPFEFAGRLFSPISAFEAFEDSWLDAAVLALCVGWWWSVADVLPMKRTHSIVREHILYEENTFCWVVVVRGRCSPCVCARVRVHVCSHMYVYVYVYVWVYVYTHTPIRDGMTTSNSEPTVFHLLSLLLSLSLTVFNLLSLSYCL
jgi:hypothetical protein